jgi:cell division protein FtsB
VEELMTNRLAHKSLPLGQILVIMAVVVAVYLLVDFGQQVQVSNERREELASLQQQIAEAEEQQAKLEEQLAYVQSSEVVEEWARQNGLVKPGEVPVVVVAPPGASTAPTENDSEGPVQPASIRETWWNLFFGNR